MRNKISLFLYFFISLFLISSCTRSEVASEQVSDPQLETRSNCDGPPDPILLNNSVFTNAQGDCCITLAFVDGYNDHVVELVGDTPSFNNPKETIVSNGVTFCPFVAGERYSLQIRDPNSSCPACVVACAIIELSAGAC